MARDSRPKSAAVRKDRKGPTKGSGGKNKRKLEGKGPTPKAEDRVYHKAHREKQLADRSKAKRTSARSRPRGSGYGADDVVAGRNPVLEALAEEVPAVELLVAADIDSDGRVREALQHCADQEVRVKEVTRRQLDNATGDAVHQGLALVMEPYEYAEAFQMLADLQEQSARGHIDHAPLLVACDSITDPRNLGAIVRSVGAFGGHGVLVPSRRSAGMTAAAWKTSAGAAARVPVAQTSNLVRALEDYRSAGFFVIGLDMEGDVELPGLELATSPLVVVVGSEGKGLSRLVRETCDQIVSIPMSSSAESLNAGIAAGVTLYEVARLRSRG